MTRLKLAAIVGVGLVVGGCASEPVDYAYTVRAETDSKAHWNRQYTGGHLVQKGNYNTVGRFDTYQEARDECDLLNFKREHPYAEYVAYVSINGGEAFAVRCGETLYLKTIGEIEELTLEARP